MFENLTIIVGNYDIALNSSNDEISEYFKDAGIKPKARLVECHPENIDDLVEATQIDLFEQTVKETVKKLSIKKDGLLCIISPFDKAEHAASFLRVYTDKLLNIQEPLKEDDVANILQIMTN